jgi:hypothetical protein
MDNVGIFYGHLTYFTAILVKFMDICLFLVTSCTKKNLATLIESGEGGLRHGGGVAARRYDLKALI